MSSTESRFLQTLKSLPMVNSGMDMYNNTKRLHFVLEYSCNVFENGATSLGERVMKISGVATLDQYASDKVEDLKCNFPILQKPADKDILDPLMRLSLKLQKPESTVGESIIWVQSTIDLIQDCKTRNPPELSALMHSGTFKGVTLKGSTPAMIYKNTIIDNLVKALEAWFQLNNTVNDSPAAAILNTTRILHFKNWPKSDSPDLTEFGESDISLVGEHFKESLTRANSKFTKDEALQEWRMLKRMLYRRLTHLNNCRHGSDLSTLSWGDAYDNDFPLMMAIIDLLNCIPPTSVKCETTFSQMKLIKTSRRTGMRSATLNNLLTVKLLSPSIQDFDPQSSVDRWQVVRKTKLRMMKKAKRGANNVLESQLGRLFMFGLDFIIRQTDSMAKYLKSDEDKRKEHINHQQEDVALERGRGRNPAAFGLDLYRQQMEALLGHEGLRAIVIHVLSYPPEITAKGLKAFRRTLWQMSGRPLHRRKSHRKTRPVELTPEKKAEIDSRRKVSPRKRIESSVFSNFCSMAYRVLGYDRGPLKQTDIRDFIKCSKQKGLTVNPAVAEDAEKKRKYEDIVSDEEGSDDSIEDLMYMDLDDYISDEDPDYRPSDDESGSESIYSDEAASESDVEIEKVNDFMQIREKEKPLVEQKDGDKETTWVNIHDPKDDKVKPVHSHRADDRKPVDDKQSDDKSKHSTPKTDDKTKLTAPKTDDKAKQTAPKSDDKAKLSTAADGKLPTQKADQKHDASKLISTDHKRHSSPGGKPVLYNGK